MPTYDYKDKSTLEALRAEGKTIAEMAKACGCSVPTMSNWLKKHGMAKTRGPRKGAGKGAAKGRRGKAATGGRRGRPAGTRGRSSGGLAEIESALAMLREAPAGMKSYKDAIKQDLVRMIQAL